MRPATWIRLLALSLCSLAAQAADPFAHPATGETLLRSMLSRPAAQLEKARTLQGNFRQSRYLRELARPLIASGEFVFARDLGVYWHTTQPFDSVIVLNEAGMVQIDEGATALRMSADEQPAVRLIGNLFTALFTLDVTRLANDFDLYGTREGMRWTIGLKPRATTIAGVIRHVTVTGSDDVEQVELVDAQGERTVLELGTIQYSRDAPREEVRALLSGR
jgi:outer membrane lipoprotein-sorting protein